MHNSDTARKPLVDGELIAIVYRFSTQSDIAKKEQDGRTRWQWANIDALDAIGEIIDRKRCKGASGE